jgi:HEAT repeat protein
MSQPHTITDAERARIERIDRLVALGPTSTDELIGALSDSSWTVRRAVVAALASLGDEAAGPLCAFLRDSRDDENALAAAVDALSSSIGPSVNAHVIALASTRSPAVVSDVAQILGRRRAAEAIPLLASLAHHQDDNVAVAAIEALGMIGGTIAVDPLIRVIEMRRFFRTFPAIQVLARTGDPRAIEPLAALLTDDTYRLEAVRALGRTGSALAIAPVTSLLRSPSDAIARVVAVALADLLERAEWAGTAEHVARVLRTALAPWLGRFVGALHGADPAERAAIATILGAAGDASMLATVTALLDDGVARAAATRALRQLDASDDELVAALATGDSIQRATLLPLVRSSAAAPLVRVLLRDDDAEVRARACEALARIGDRATARHLFEALGDPSPRVTHAAISALSALGAPDTEERALEAVRSEDPAMRRHAIRLLGTFGFASAFEPLRAAIADHDRRIAELAVVSLGSVDDPQVDVVLAEVASSPDGGLRAAAMRGAVHRGGSASEHLLARGISDPEPWVRYYAAQGLGRIGGDDLARPTRLLVERLRDPSPQVRIAVIEALSHLPCDEAWDAVCRAATSTDPDERRAGLVGVRLQGRPLATAILLDAARSPDPATRLVALAGLATRNEPSAIAALDAAIDDTSPEVREAALSLLADRDDGPAAAILIERALTSEHDHPVHQMLSRPGAARIAAILSRLATADDRAAPVLVAALARMHDTTATAALFDALALANSAARAAAAGALAAAGTDDGVRAVRQLAAADPDPDVRRVCRALLGIT